MLREPGRPAVAYMVTPDEERRYVGGAFITLNDELRERLWARVQAKAKPVKGVERKAGIQWLKPGLIARVRYLKGEESCATQRCVRCWTNSRGRSELIRARHMFLFRSHADREPR